jgi:dTDP-glucose 4,6-dehydratase
MSKIFTEDISNVLAFVPSESWEKLRDANIFMTGGTGYFGSWMLASFLAANKRYNLNAKVVVLARNPAKLYTRHPEFIGENAISTVCGDLLSFEFPREKFTHIFHFAIETLPPKAMLETIIAGIQRLLILAQQAESKDFLFASSGAVYGALPADLQRVPETYLGAPDPNDPRSAYGEGKRVAELLLNIAYSEWGLNVKTARCFAQVGPYMPLDAAFAVGNFIGDALAGRPIQIKGDGTPIRSYIYGSDLAIWLWTILFQGKSGRPYNVGGVTPVSIAQVAEIVNQAFGGNIGINIHRKIEGAPIRNQYVPDVSRAEAELGLKIRVSLENAVKRCIEAGV